MLTPEQNKQLHKELRERGWELVAVGNDCMEWRSTRWGFSSQGTDVQFAQDVCAILSVEICF